MWDCAKPISTIRVTDIATSRVVASTRQSVRDRHTFRELIVIRTCVMFTMTYHCTQLRCWQVQQFDRIRALLGNDEFSVKKISKLHQNVPSSP